MYSLKKKAQEFLKKVAKGKKELPELNLLIPDEHYLNLRSRYYSYRNLLLKNNELLDALTEVEEGLESKTLTIQTFRSYLARIFDTAFGFIQSLNDMTGNRYMKLYTILDRIKTRTERRFEEKREEEESGLVIPHERITSESFKDTGNKASNLGEVRNILNIPSPRGFSITTKAYREFLSFNNLGEKINNLLGTLDISDNERTDTVSREISELILTSQVPVHIEEEIMKAVDLIDRDRNFSVRSSAVGEDGKVSFAGQFGSVLNVKRKDIINAYKEVVASKYSIRAIFYREAKKIRDKDMPMAVFVQEMIDSRSSGVLYTLNPGYPEKDETLITSVWGQGKYAVGGKISPDLFVLNRRQNGTIVSRVIPAKKVKLVMKPSGGMEEVKVPEDEQDAPSISDAEIHELYAISCTLERHFGSPQDIEWTIDSNGRIQLLQTRPLHVRRVIQPSVPDTFAEKKVVLAKGETASRGISAGPVFIVDKFEQIEDFPYGAILVARNSSNEYVKLMKSASAVIIETGSVTSHLATVAREFNIPTLVNTPNIREILRGEKIVTVDATSGRIYRGRMEGIIRPEKTVKPVQETSADEKMMREIMKNITPLNLIRLDETDVAPEEFKTVHDIIRYVHEVSVREMFRLGEFSGGESSTQQLVSNLVPMRFYIIDLDGGVVDEAKFLRKITPEHIRSIPFRALWNGMTHEGVRWSGPVDIDMGGLASVMARSFVRTGVTEKGGKVYVIVTEQYINMSVKLAYHFTVFDAFCGESYINNYINFRFQGGGASAEGRYRRTVFLQEVLESLDFRVELKGDMIIANIKGASQKDTEYRLDILGRLLGCSRQLDMAISSMEAKDWYVKAFLEGNYSFVHD